MIDYKPDLAFTKELKRADKRLDCRFNGQFYVITYERPCGGSVPIMSVRGADGGFRQPDQRDIMKLKESDLAREDYREKFMRMGKMSEYLTEQEKSRRKRRELFRNIAKDSKHQLRNAFAKAANVGKSNAGFRQVQIKPKGKVFGAVVK